MLVDLFTRSLSSSDLWVSEKVVPADHSLRDVESIIPWDDFHDILAPDDSQDLGRTPNSTRHDVEAGVSPLSSPSL
jgi:hypothetical protein